MFGAAQTAGTTATPRRSLLLLLPLPAAGGAGLLIYVLGGVSLPLAAGALLAGGVLAWAMVISRLPGSARMVLWRRVRLGLCAGIVATASYDAARYGLVSLFQLSFRPFHVFTIFGHLFIGKDAPERLAFAVGSAYHVSNGIGFGIVYTLLSRKGSPWTGIVWGIFLELCMALLYPSWLRIEALKEFLTISAVGHVVYGAALGTVVARGAIPRRIARGEQ